MRDRLLDEVAVEEETVLGIRGSAEKSSLTESSDSLVERLKGAVGRAMPNLTGANRALADSHNSSTAMLIRP